MLARHVSFALVLAACSSSGPPAQQPDALRTTIADTNTELDAYYATIHMVTTKSEVDYAVADHQGRMTTLVGDMGGYLHGMASCMNTEQMSGQRHGVILDLQMHVAMMQDLTTIDAERVEVDRHVHTTGVLLTDMSDMLDASTGCGN